MQDPRKPGGRYFSGYWAHEYTVNTMFSSVHWSEGQPMPGITWYDVTWIPSEDATHPRQSDQWRGDGYHRSRHCTSWDARRDEIVSQP